MDDARIFTRLRALLIKEREILKSQDFDKMADLIAEKEEVLGELQQMELHGSDQMDEIRSESEHNHRLLQATQAGVREALERATQLKAGPRSLGIYAPDGRKSQIGQSAPRLERRS